MRILFLLSVFGLFGFSADVEIPTINLSLTAPNNPTQLVTSLNVLIALTVLTLAPGLIFMMTSFLRLVIVFSFLRQAMGTQQMPPSTLLISIAMVLTFFIMEPVAKQSYENGIKPYLAEQIGYEESFDKSIKPFKEFMVRNTREKDLALFFRIRNLQNPANIDEIPLTIAMSAFAISELKTAFEIAFLLYLPFLVIDMVVSSVLMSMGMMMLPPVMISLPFKLLIFVLVDGWNLLVGNLVESFH
ncbi:flagellar type III secretion system pore protein FliP [Campylobacter pinnipediorum]|uniref:Flagellar biosynthetic protein FliP n=2 Tax=Campylobacter pinnipediorum TaxID=1965231 RepID=A0A1S6U7V5_9BACT|nr:flagellar type III secretion system pore protein FliP [Campylobacter pinnipediorum]AQW81421.1 flagellar export apparatus, flagellar biosynthetic protein FliP [Campylobacter pinnipediorum subsp. pinnipediorum]AQW83049.1 flagellar export apparatus, flagellar biosynthetic protein FliP [Campylobacter pinnipediorum subsp. pinnipediorum]AQW86223.1 flagellar export apparatus, flagellar biosynthetic protein FliP [Campylobacter pinnipediorum subsp. caledonicus]AQW87831.1 flagellar export apparatus, f